MARRFSRISRRIRNPRPGRIRRYKIGRRKYLRKIRRRR